MKSVNPCIESLEEKLEELHAERLAMGYFAAPTPAQEQEAERIHTHYLDIISNMLNSMERETKSLYVTSLYCMHVSQLVSSGIEKVSSMLTNQNIMDSAAQPIVQHLHAAVCGDTVLMRVCSCT